MPRWVLDTNVIIAARRSRAGASNALLRAADKGQFAILASVPLFIEYEAVLCRPEHLAASGLTILEAASFLDYLASIAVPVKMHYLWRPQLSDIADEMVLETAINGQAQALVTFNTRHFAAAEKFGIEVIRPDEAIGRVK